MSSMNPAPSPDTLITIKLALNASENRRFKLPLRDLGANTFPEKLRSLLAVAPSQIVIFERFSDSAGAYITLDSNNPSVYKQLYRAAKAKLKLRIKATVTPVAPVNTESSAVPLAASNHPPPQQSVQVHADHKPISGTTAPVASPTTGAKPIPDQPEHQLQKSPRSKLPYDPCASPSVTSPPSLLNTANLFSSQNLAAHQDYQLQLMLLEQQNKKRLLMAREEALAKAEPPKPQCFVPFVPSPATGFGSLPQRPNLSAGQFTICCNNCDVAIPDAHWHCSICDSGDFDLCKDCVEKGFLCDSDEHWLIKREVKDGQVVNSTTETIDPKSRDKSPVEEGTQEDAFATCEPKEKPFCMSPDPVAATRTCNSCVGVFDEVNFVTCANCDDYDLCIPCHVGLRHGHDPRHTFAPTCEKTTLDLKAKALCSAGRGMRHFAICDGCEKDIFGVRHKCLNCPDWDYCTECIKNARTSHPGHRFARFCEAIPFTSFRAAVVHYGINCDGPLCKDVQGYIKGDRYKCAVCHDTDFCAKCEALPMLRHNRTHPLIKFKSPVRNVSVTTLGEKENGELMCTMGDQLPHTTSSKSTETTPAVPSANAATQVQTVAEIKPVEETKAEPEEDVAKSQAWELQAHFIRDAVADGSVLPPSTQFEQVWTLRNPGPHAWPEGCSVRFIGGDAMFNVDPNHPSSVSDIVKATESNVMNRVVAVGEEVNFTVVMRTPERQGKAISYWRLKAANGQPFGHKLWCDVDVRSPKEEASDNKKEAQPTAKWTEDSGAKEAEVNEEEKSQMIFPKLEKESPVNSTHEAQSGAPVVTAAEEKELLEDVESMGLEDDDSTDDGFLTDEEYEMLNASEDEFAEAVNGKK